MKVTILNAYSILREDKTGVDVFWCELTRAFLHYEKVVDIKIAEIAPGAKQLKEKCKSEENTFVKDSLLLKRIPYRWRELIPIELITGRSGVFLVGGWMPKKTRNSTKILPVIHDLMIYRYPENYSKESYHYQDVYFKKCAKKADMIIVVSETTKQDVVKYLNVSPDKIFIVNNGVSEDFAKRVTLDEADTARIDYSRKYLLYIGAMRRNKNLMRTIQAFEQYCNDNPEEDLFFYIAGAKKGEYEKLNNYVIEHQLEDRVIFIGYVSDTEKQLLYKNAYASVLVSEFEGFGIPIVESMAAGTPVITSNCSSMKEIAEGYGILVDPMDIESIKSGISLLKDAGTYKDYVRKGYVCAEKYSWNHAAEQLMDLCRDISAK